MRPLPRLVALLAALLGAAAGAQAPAPDPATDPWYRVELLVFRHTAPEALTAEAWPPFPSLAYPERFRFLVEPDRADRRLAYYPRATSTVDDHGIQTVSIEAPPPLRDPNAPLLSAAERAAVPLEPSRPDGQLGVAPGSVPAEEAPPDPNAPPPLPRAFQALADRELPSGRLARGAYEVLWHESWLQPLPAQEDAVPLVLDHSGDLEADDPWPRLQGSVRLYLSRYLHVETDLWLNTDGSYFPEGWRSEPPPAGPPSLHLSVPEGFALAEGDGAAVLLPTLPDPVAGALPWEVPALDLEAWSGGLRPAGDGGGTPTDRPPEWTWRHAVALREQRRMRGGETHYLDHPLFGVIIRVQPLDEEALADWGGRLADPSWAERHGVVIPRREVAPPGR